MKNNGEPCSLTVHACVESEMIEKYLWWGINNEEKIIKMRKGMERE